MYSLIKLFQSVDQDIKFNQQSVVCGPELVLEKGKHLENSIERTYLSHYAKRNKVATGKQMWE